MDRESVDRLRFDIRLKRRPGWVSAEDQTSHRESLPDLSDKMMRGFDEEEEEASAPASESEPSAPAFSALPTDPSQAAAQTPAAEAPQTPPTPIPFGSSASPSSTFSDDGTSGGSGFSE